MDELIKQTGVFAVQSAVKLTEPGNGSNLSKLPVKHRFRPLVRIPEGHGYYYTRDGSTIFKVDKPINTRLKRNQGVKRVTKGIKNWSKKQRRFTYIPYIGTKRDTSDPRFKIPFAGAAKAGWLKALPKLGNAKSIDIGNNKRGGKRYSKVRKSRGFLEIHNMVSYVSKTSPNAARGAVRKASNRMRKIWIPKVERRVARDWRRARQSFIRGLRFV